MRWGFGLKKIAAFCVVALVIGTVIGFHIGSIYVEAGTVTKSFTLTATIVETVFQTTTKPVLHTVTETSTRTVTATALSTITKSSMKTTTVFEEGGEVEVLGVCFSRTMNCSSLIGYWIARANESVHIMIYGFTLDYLSKALIDAVKRGVEVEVIIEKESAYWRGSEYERLLQAGVDVKLDGNPYTMHHKVAIIDGKIVITGSYNWTWSAERRNDENVLILMSKSLAKNYEKEFQRVWSMAS